MTLAFIIADLFNLFSLAFLEREVLIRADRYI